MKHVLFALFLSLLTQDVSGGVTVSINGISYYLILDQNVASLTKMPTDTHGTFTIPDYIEYEGVNYTVTTISNSAFQGCKLLTSISIPNNVTSIGGHAFYGCSGLTSITIPNSVTSIGNYAFSGCSGLTSITIPNSVTTIGEGTFQGCSGLTTVTIPNNVTTIGCYAFRNCSSLISANLPNKLTRIQRGTFWDCGKLESIKIPQKVKEIESLAFYECNSLRSVHIDDLAAWCNITFYPSFNNINDLYDLSNPLYNAKHLYVNDKEITDIILPDGVTIVKDWAFYGCSGIKNVILPNSVKTLGDSSFRGCSFSSIFISSNLTSIGKETFRSCKNLSSITIPDGVISIGDGAFQYCTQLSSVSLPNSVMAIGEFAFENCSNLSFVVLPKSINIIRSRTFAGCGNLKSIIIPQEVEYIYQRAFGRSFSWGAECGLEDIKILAENPPFTYDDSFSNYNIPLYVPSSSVEAYLATSPWNRFATIKTLSGEDVEVKKCKKPTVRYENGEISFSCETEGVQFISSITDSDIKDYNVARIPLNVTYMISVHATKAGYEDSDVATATLCWIDKEPSTEGITSIAQIRAKAIMIQNYGNVLTIQGADENTPISVYEINGTLAGTGISRDGTATVTTNLRPSSIAIVKIGDKSVKVMMK